MMTWECGMSTIACIPVCLHDCMMSISCPSYCLLNSFSLMADSKQKIKKKQVSVKIPGWWSDWLVNDPITKLRRCLHKLPPYVWLHPRLFLYNGWLCRLPAWSLLETKCETRWCQNIPPPSPRWVLVSHSLHFIVQIRWSFKSYPCSEDNYLCWARM